MGCTGFTGCPDLYMAIVRSKSEVSRTLRDEPDVVSQHHESCLRSEAGDCYNTQHNSMNYLPQSHSLISKFLRCFSYGIDLSSWDSLPELSCS
jgi:hypothetical protein